MEGSSWVGCTPLGYPTRVLLPRDLPIVAVLEEAAARVLAELATVPESAWFPMAAQSMYRGRWEAVLLSAGPWAHEFAGVDLDANRRRLPSAAAILEKHPELGVFGVLRLAPGAELAPHRDRRDDDEVRVHVALQVPPEELGEWTVGTARLLDIRQIHHAYNRGNIDRITLVADVRVGRIVAIDEVAPWNDPLAPAPIG